MQTLTISAEAKAALDGFTLGIIALREGEADVTEGFARRLKQRAWPGEDASTTIIRAIREDGWDGGGPTPEA